MYSLSSYSIAARSSQLGAVFQMLGIDHKTMDSLRSLSFFARFARSRGKFQHKNINFLGFKALKNGFSGSLGATFLCVARRHSLINYFDCLNILN